MQQTHTAYSYLAASDLSAPSRQAVERAALMARASGASLTAVHVIDHSLMDELRLRLAHAPQLIEKLTAQGQQGLDALLQPVIQRFELPIRTEVVMGAVLEELLAAAARTQATLIVVGARGEGYLRRWTLGTTAERLLNRSRVPVLVVKQPVHEEYRRVLIPVDFSPWSTITVGLVRQLLPNAHLVLMHAWSVPFREKLLFAGVELEQIEIFGNTAQIQARQRLQQLADEHALEVSMWTPSVVEGDADLCIASQELEQDCDLIAMGKQGQRAVEAVLLGSVTEHVLSESQSDVLVVTNDAKA